MSQLELCAFRPPIRPSHRMKLATLIQEYRDKKSLLVDQRVLEEDAARTLERCIGTPRIQIESATVLVHESVKSATAHRRKVAILRSMIDVRMQHREIERNQDLGVNAKREQLQQVEWAFVKTVQRLGLKVPGARRSAAEQLYQATLQISDRKLIRRYRLSRLPVSRPSSMVMKGSHTLRTPQGTFSLQVTGDFFERHGKLGYLLRLEGFADAYAQQVLQGLGLGAWAAHLRAVRPQLLIASQAMQTQVENVNIPLEPGLNFAARFGIGPNLARLMGAPEALVLAGPLRIEAGRPAPTLDLATYPPCELQLHNVRLHHGFLSLRTAWASMDAPPVLPDTAPEAAEFAAPPNEHVRMMEIGVSGTYPLVNFSEVRLWSSLPADTGVLVFNKHRDPNRMDTTVNDLSTLDTLLGGRDWRENFPNQRLLDQARPYTLRNLTPFHDLNAQRVTSITVELTSQHDVALPGLEGYLLQGLTLTFVVGFPHGGGTRSVYSTGAGTLRVGNLAFEATLAIPSLRIDASSENGALAEAAVAQAAFLRGLQLTAPGPADARYTHFYLGLEPTDAGYVVAGFAATNDDGAEREWRRPR